MVASDISAAFAAGRVPEGVTAEYLEQERDGGPLAGIFTVGILTILIVFLRLYARLFIVKRVGADDYLAVLTTTLYIPFIALSVILIRLGSGRHMEYIQYVLSPSTVNLTEILDYAAHIIYTTALYTCRLSGVAFYRRLSERHRKLLIVINISAVVMTMGVIPQLLLIILHCIPVTGLWPYAWQAESASYKCLSWGIVYSVNSAISLFCDFVVFTIPVAIIVLLKVDRWRKLKLSLILFPGVIVIIISIVRLYLVVQGQWVADGSWFYSPMLAIENAEIGGTLTALSVPGLKPLFGSWLSRIDKSFFSRSNTTKESATLGSRKNQGSQGNPRGKSYQRAASDASLRDGGKPRDSSDEHLLEAGHVKANPSEQRGGVTVSTWSIPMEPLAAR